jgi:hypothetical protein
MKSAPLAAAFAGVFFVSSAFATPSPAKAQPVASQPAPVFVVNPTDLPLSLAGKIINVEFKLDAVGRPHDIRVPAVQDRQVVRKFTQVFRQWKFSPAPGDASAQETRFVLPLQINS